MSTRIDAGDYANADLLTFKIPFTLPYVNPDSDYTTVKGTFEHQGSFFTMIKQKIDRDTLYLVCLNDRPKQELVTHLSNFIKHSNDTPSGTLPVVKPAIGFSKSYLQQILALQPDINGWESDIVFVSVERTPLSQHYPVLFMPPDFSV